MQISGAGRDRGVTPQMGPTGGSRAPRLPTGFGAGAPKGVPRAEQGLLRLFSPFWVTGTLLVAKCWHRTLHPIASSHPGSDFSATFLPRAHPDLTEKKNKIIIARHRALGCISLPLHTLPSDFSPLSVAAVGSYFHISLDSLQGTGSEPDGHRTSASEPPPRQHLSKSPSSSVCVCVQCTLATYHDQSFAAGVHVGLSSLSERANALYLCARGKMLHVQIQMLLCSPRAPRGEFFLGVHRCLVCPWDAGCYGMCFFKSKLCFAELALCSV